MIWHDVLMLVVGMVMLVASLKPIAAVTNILGQSRLRRSWYVLRGLVLAFIASYAAFAVLQYNQPPGITISIVSAIFMAGGAFVLVVAYLSEQTTADIVRISKLENDVVRDPLTGAFNRRFLEETLPTAIASARRTQRPLSALLVDLDHFKRINDTYGHATGDLVLKRVSSLILHSARTGDTVIRYGGEEFLIIVPDTDLDAATKLGERMLDGIRVEDIVLPDGQTIRATASIGAATLSMNNGSDDMVARADQALYAAKKGGRNQVCFA